MNTEESERFATLDSDINTYVSEYTLKFITGDVPLSEYDTYCETIASMGVDEVVGIVQDAYTRYASRSGI